MVERFKKKLALSVYMFFIPHMIMYSKDYNPSTFVKEVTEQFKEAIVIWRNI